MVRLSDLHPEEQEHMLARLDGISPIEPAPWISPKPLSESKVAIISTAGLHSRDDRPFTIGTNEYRLIDGSTPAGDLVMSHISTNFDRSAFQQDINVCFPIDRLREMADAGEIGAVSQWHYSLMGAMPDPANFEVPATELGRLLAADDVDVALLVPV